jgi:hypothetical protein
MHYWPGIRHGCDAGLRATRDCHGCPAYHDGTPYLGTSESDAERQRCWETAFATPQAHFRGQING